MKNDFSGKGLDQFGKDQFKGLVRCIDNIFYAIIEDRESFLRVVCIEDSKIIDYVNDYSNDPKCYFSLAAFLSYGLIPPTYIKRKKFIQIVEWLKVNDITPFYYNKQYEKITL